MCIEKTMRYNQINNKYEINMLKRNSYEMLLLNKQHIIANTNRYINIRNDNMFNSTNRYINIYIYIYIYIYYNR